MRLRLFLLLGPFLLLLGCGPSPEAQKTGAIEGRTEQRRKEFYAKLNALPSSERAQYMKDHLADLRTISGMAGGQATAPRN